MQVICSRKVVKTVNILNLEQNFWPNFKKERRSKSTKYFLNSRAKNKSVMLKTKSQGKPDRREVLSLILLSSLN